MLYYLGMTLYLCMKAALTEPRFLEMCMNFEIATATWLSEVALHDNPKSFTPETFPMPEDASTVLACVPEFIMGNVTDFTLFLQRFKDDMYEVSKVWIILRAKCQGHIVQNVKKDLWLKLR